MLPIRKIIHPTDFSDRSQPSFELACSLARDYGAELVVLHVAQLPLLMPMNGVLVPTPVDEADAARDQLDKIHADDPRVKLVHRLAEGCPADEILTAASDLPADLIVMGSHGRSGLARVLMGSVAEEVMRKSPCPVLTVKSPCPVLAAKPPCRPECENRKKTNTVASTDRATDAQVEPPSGPTPAGCKQRGDCR